jgi:quercetin dioxygenase-like cupin family protein
MNSEDSVPTYFVNAQSVQPYHPANHSGTTNYRLIGPETVGAKMVEVVLGVIEKGEGALPHSHPGVEQICYMLEGRVLAEVGGQSREIGPGDCCFFPAGMRHIFTVTSDTAARFLVIYAPPYLESPEKVKRG